MKDVTSKAAQAAVGYRKHRRKAGKRMTNKGSRQLAKAAVAKAAHENLDRGCHTGPPLHTLAGGHDE